MLFRKWSNNSVVIESSLDLDLSNGLFVIIHGWMGTVDNTRYWHQPMMNNLFTIMVNFIPKLIFLISFKISLFQ